eukprot:2489441-Pyramimonas_sp.AAC.1
MPPHPMQATTDDTKTFEQATDTRGHGKLSYIGYISDVCNHPTAHQEDVSFSKSEASIHPQIHEVSLSHSHLLLLHPIHATLLTAPTADI